MRLFDNRNFSQTAITLLTFDPLWGELKLVTRGIAQLFIDTALVITLMPSLVLRFSNTLLLFARACFAMFAITLFVAWPSYPRAQAKIDLSLVQEIHGSNEDVYTRSPYGGWRQKVQGVSNIKLLREVSSINSTLVVEIYPGENFSFDFDKKMASLLSCPAPPIACTNTPYSLGPFDFSYRLPKLARAIKNLDSVAEVYLAAQVNYTRTSQNTFQRIAAPGKGGQQNPGVTEFVLTGQTQGRISLQEAAKSGAVSGQASVVIDLSEARVFETWPGLPTTVSQILDVTTSIADPTQSETALTADQAAAARAPILFSRVGMSILVEGGGLNLGDTSKVSGDDRAKFVLEKKAGADDLYYIRSLSHSAGSSANLYLFQTPGNYADVETVNNNDPNSPTISPDRDLLRLFRLNPTSTSTTIFNPSMGTDLSDWQRPSTALTFSWPQGNETFDIKSLPTDTVTVRFHRDSGSVSANSTDQDVLAALTINAITRDEHWIPLVTKDEWSLVGGSSDTLKIYQANLSTNIDPSSIGAIVKIALKNSNANFNVVVDDVQLRGRDLFACNCSLHAVDADPTLVRNINYITTSDVISFNDAGMPSLSPSLLSQNLDNLDKVVRLRGTLQKQTSSWLQVEHELFDPLLMTAGEKSAFDDFLFCYSFVLDGARNGHDFIGDFLGLNVSGHPDATDVSTTLARMTGASQCANSGNPLYDRTQEAYKTMSIELRKLLHERARLNQLITTASNVYKHKYEIAEASRELFETLAGISEGSAPSGVTNTTGADLADAEIGLGVLAVIPGVSTVGGVAEESATLIGDVMTSISESETSAANVVANSPPSTETSANDLQNNIILAVINAKSTLESEQKLEQDKLTKLGQALVADIPMLAESFPQLPDDAATSAGGTGASPLVSDQGKWDIRASVWSRLLPLKVVLIGRPVFSCRENYGSLPFGVPIPATLWGGWDSSLDAALFEDDDAALTSRRTGFQQCLDSASCATASATCTVAAPETTLDKNTFLFSAKLHRLGTTTLV